MIPSGELVIQLCRKKHDSGEYVGHVAHLMIDDAEFSHENLPCFKFIIIIICRDIVLHFGNTFDVEFLRALIYKRERKKEIERYIKKVFREYTYV